MPEVFRPNRTAVGTCGASAVHLENYSVEVIILSPIYAFMDFFLSSCGQ